MGSLGGAAVGALLLGLTTNFAAAYLPADYTFYSIIFTFILLAIVLAIRPLGPVRAGPHDGGAAAAGDGVGRSCGRVGDPALRAASRRSCLTEYWIAALLTQMLLLGVVAASLIFLSAYGGMVSLAQVADLRHRRLRARQPDDERQHQGHEPRLGGGARGRRRDRGRARGRVHLRRAGQSQLRDLLPDDHARLLRDRQPRLRAGDEHLGLRRHQRHPDPRLPEPHGPSGAAVLRDARGRADRLRRCCATSSGRRSG